MREKISHWHSGYKSAALHVISPTFDLPMRQSWCMKPQIQCRMEHHGLTNTLSVYNITQHDMYDSSVAPELIRNTSATRGNKYKRLNHTFHYNFRKFSFAARIVNIWNSLPDYVVDVNSVALFKQEAQLLLGQPTVRCYF